MSGSFHELRIGFEPGLVLYEFHGLVLQERILLLFLRSSSLEFVEAVALGDEDAKDSDQQQDNEKGPGKSVDNNPVAHRLLLIVWSGTRSLRGAGILYYAAVDGIVAKHFFNAEELIVLANPVCS